jgi:acyl-[acyl-carrier-protein]-phospholipid O-acyltransferase / long-chain-fatty-acid--[acyl-carrier-protein] ligase
MILLGIPLAILALWLTAAGLLVWRLGLDFRQALTYAPLKLLFRISDREARIAREAAGPVIYVVVHQSRLDPALMLALLPDQTLHILDEHSAKTMWLEPYRELARTIPFNAEHVFVSRRLVRHLRGKGRLAVYMPDLAEPDAKSFRLYRAVARIAVAAEARIVPIIVDGARDFSLSLAGPTESARRWLPKLSIQALAPQTIAELAARSAEPSLSASTLFDRVAEARLAAASLERSLFKAIRKAARHFGRDRIAVEGGNTRLTYRQLFTEARLLGLSLAAKSAPGETVGLLLPNSPALATAFLGLLSAGRPAAMLDPASGAASITVAVRGAMIRTVLASRHFVAQSGLANVVAAAEAGGARLLWLEDIEAGWLDRQFARLQSRQPIARTDGDAPALALGDRLLSHRNLHANAMQLAARLDLSRQDSLLSLVPPSHPFSLVPGLILPLLTGVRALLDPAAASTAATKPTILVAAGSDLVATGSDRVVPSNDQDLRLVVAFNRTGSVQQFGRPGARVLDGFGLPEAGSIVTLNAGAQSREGSVGRLLPGMRARIEPVDGIADGGRLWITGPNLAAPAGRQAGSKDSWHETGLIVAFDREGFLFVRGRAARIASVGGEIVSLDAIEALAATLWPEARHAAVTVPDRRKGERVVIVTTAGAAKAADLKRGAKGRGTSASAGDILLVEEIPTLAGGHTDYEAVRRLAAEQRPGRKKAA